MTPKQKTMAWLGGGVALMVVGTAVMFVLAKSCTPAPPPKLVISKETTYLTGPLHADGGIDWVAALEAEARAEGLKDEENGAPVLKEALSGFVSFLDFALEKEPFASQDNPYDAIDVAIAALENGKLDATGVDGVFAWLDSCAPAMEKANSAAKRPRWFLVVPGRSLENFSTNNQLSALDDLLQAFRLRLAARAVRGDVEGALTDAATAWALARRFGSPATSFEQCHAVRREIDVLEQVLSSLRGAPSSTANRALAIFEAPPAAWVGEVALREMLRAERLAATSVLDAARFADPAKVGSPREGVGEGWCKAEFSLPPTDLNPAFLRVQRTFDDLERRLLGSSQPVRARLDAFFAAITGLEEAGQSISPKRTGPLRFAFLSDERVADLLVDQHLGTHALLMHGNISGWLSFTARRDALLAELAARAGAPGRRDSWLGEPLIVTRKADGSIEIGGALIDLARERGAKLDEE